MRGVFLTHQAAGEERESGLHEEDQIAGVESPGKIGGEAEMSDVVGG